MNALLKKARDGITWNGAIAAALALSGLVLFCLHVAPAQLGWFVNEDSRFFSNGDFSFYDLWVVFTTPMNSMGQYRPITKLLWSVPRWLGFFNASAYHLVSLGLVVAACGALARLHFRLFGSVLAAVFAGAIFLLLPVHLKPIYWISAWHNTAAVLFSLLALLARLEMWHSEKRAGLWRIAGLVFFFLAIASREVAYGLPALFLWIDWREARSLRKSWDYLLIAGTMFLILLVFTPSLKTANVALDPGIYLDPLRLLKSMFHMTGGVLFGSDDQGFVMPGWPRWIAIGVLALLFLAPLISLEFVFPLLLFLVGIGPFLMLVDYHMEYGVVFCAGIVLSVTGLVAFLLRKVKGAVLPAVVAFLAFGVLLGLHSYHGASLRSFNFQYREPSVAMKNFISELKSFVATQPKFDSFRIVKFDPNQESKIWDTLHFLINGVDEMVPTHVIAFDHEVLGIADGTAWRESNSNIWKYYLTKVTPPKKIRVDKKGKIHLD